MVGIVICMLPAKWTEQMMAANMKPYNMEVSDLKGYLPGLQKTQSSESAVPKKNGRYDKTKRELPEKLNKHQKAKLEKRATAEVVEKETGETEAAKSSSAATAKTSKTGIMKPIKRLIVVF